MTETAEKRNYKKTLNLPKTSFPMRANLAQNEGQSRKRWDGMKLYERAQDVHKDDPLFVFHDGPPYANGSIHAGHLLNKVLKDMVVRSRLLGGQACPFIPGWDCHGLPIEHRVMLELHESGKIEKLNALDDETRRVAIRRACHKYAEKYVKLQAGQMQRLLTLADYAHPYLTMDPHYEEGVLEVFASMLEEGVVYRDLKPVHWSIANETALAEAELEYEDREDLSVYVNFEAVDPGAVANAFNTQVSSTPSFMIWTTTPWTLPANLAVAVKDDFRYALVDVDGALVVLASDRVKDVTEAAGAKSVNVLAETDGANLVGLQYRHALCAKTCPVVDAPYVTVEDGTGLVHTAPGHGTEDYQTGKRVGLEIYCPVQADGTYDDTVPEWLRGMSVWDANEKVTEHLRSSGHLYYDHRFVHSYPHDWRSKTPVIFRSTEQWFVSVDKPTKHESKSLRDLALGAAEDEISFIPEWGRNRFRGMLESRPDWCLSRQRAWGLPIPAFFTPEGKPFLTPASVRAVAAHIGKKGSDFWFTEAPAELLEGYDPGADPDAPAGLDLASLTKGHDIFDVWFESGSSWHAAMEQRGLGAPVDLYLEGSDQHRGWFQLSLLPGLSMKGHTPFKTVLTHGFIVDKDGKKMSKSGGNALDVDDVLKEHGADVARWWISSLAVETDVRADMEFFGVAGESYRKVRNTLRFLLSNLGDFTPCTKDNPDGMCVDLRGLSATGIDAYIMSEAGKLQETVRAAYRKCEFRRVQQAVFDFCNDTLSSFYLTAVKDRLYCDAPDSPRRRTTQTVIWDLLELLTRVLAPILPHTADEAYRALWNDEERCVHLERFVDWPETNVDESWPKVFLMRDRVLKTLEDAKTQGIDNALDAEIVVPDPDGTYARFAADFADMCGVSRVSFGATEGEPTVKDLREEPRCERSWKRDGTVKQRSDGGMLSDRDAAAVGV